MSRYESYNNATFSQLPFNVHASFSTLFLFDNAAIPRAKATGVPMTTQRAKTPSSSASPMFVVYSMLSTRSSRPSNKRIKWPMENRKISAPQMVNGSERNPSDH